jgi:hypothetical protein
MKAFFSYNSTASGELKIVTNEALGTVNQLISSSRVGAVQLEPITVFKPGINRGAMVVERFDTTVTWSVQAAGARLSIAVADARTKVCAPVEPLIECVNTVGKNTTARLAYRNPNQFSVPIPIGTSNMFYTMPLDRGQPAIFKPGLNLNVAVVPVTVGGMIDEWLLNGKGARIDENTPKCAAGCSELTLDEVKGNLDKVALRMSALVGQAAGILRAAKLSSTTVRRNGALVRRTRNDEIRSLGKAQAYRERVYKLVLMFPEVAQVCQRETFCRFIDRWGVIMELRQIFARTRNTGMRILARKNFVSTGRTSRTEAIVRELKSLEKLGNENLNRLPRVASDCG